MTGSPDPFFEIRGLLKKVKTISDQTAILIAANVKDITVDNRDYASHSIVTEYFTEQEIEDIVIAFRSNGFYVDVSYDERDFINKTISDTWLDLPHRYKVVYSSAQKGTGPGRKSLIPALCNMLQLPIMGSNAYVRSLCRHKYHTASILRYHGVQKLNVWLYDYNNGWLLDQRPEMNTKVILKPIYESASIGVDTSGVFTYNKERDAQIHAYSKQFNQPVIIQSFVEGFEVEVPLLCTKTKSNALGVVGISLESEPFLGEKILTYDLVYSDQYEFYDAAGCLSPETIAAIKECAEKSAIILGIEGLGRLDFRVTKNGEFFITDVSTNPHIVRHSAFGYLYDKNGMNYSDLPLSMLAVMNFN